MEGAAGNKKAAKQNAAKLMLDVLDGRAKVRVHKIWRKEDNFFVYVLNSVADPDLNLVPDPHVFGPPGSGSITVVRGVDPDPSIKK